MTDHLHRAVGQDDGLVRRRIDDAGIDDHAERPRQGGVFRWQQGVISGRQSRTTGQINRLARGEAGLRQRRVVGGDLAAKAGDDP